MKKSKRIVILICILLSLCIFAVACDNNSNASDDKKHLSLEYISSSNIIKWKANWAEKFDLAVYYGDSIDGFLIYSEKDIKATDNHRKLGIYYEQSGIYLIKVDAYAGGEVVSQTILADVELEEEDQYPDDDYEEQPVEPDESEDFKSDIGRLKKVYYHLANSDDDLSITLANQNGVKSVSGFHLSQYGDWSYDKTNNAIKFSKIYLNRFSLGARLTFDVAYNDGRVGKIHIELVKTLPMDIVKGGISLASSQAYSNNTNGVISVLNLALNYDIFLGYGKEVASEGSINYIKNVCIDGKKLLSSSYSCSFKESKIMLTANKSLSGLSHGMHLLEIYTVYGKSEVWLNVKGSNTYPIDVEIDYDSSFPNIYVRWDMLRNDAEQFIVKIRDKNYSSQDFPDLFDGYKFDATGKIKYGDEVRVSAVIDKKEEISFATTLKVDINNAVIKNYLSYDKSFEYLGARYNTFIDDYEELKDLVFYSLIHYDKLTASNDSGFEKMWTIYVNTSLANNATELSKNIKAAEEYFNEGIKSTWQVVKDKNLNVYKLYFTVSSSCIPDSTLQSTNIKENKYNDVHFSSTGRSNNYDDFAVNKLQNTAQVTYSEELYLALERGIRPIPNQGSPAQKVYEKAKAILRVIVDDSMNDFQKVHAIVDWLSCYVTYNWELSDEISKTEVSSSEYLKFYTCREMFLEGAILDGLAVCNGYAKAMSLLCGIEGITCYKIKGESGQGQGIINPVYSNHAWNKVYIEGGWYVLDSTWANEKYKYGNSSVCEVLKHNTIFMNEEQSGNFKDGAHHEVYSGVYSGYYAGSAYDIFANTFFMYDGNIYDMVIDDEKELEILLNYLIATKCKDMGHNTYVSVDVRCNNEMLDKYIDALKSDGLDLFKNYNVSVKYANTYGSMTSLILWKQ